MPRMNFAKNIENAFAKHDTDYSAVKNLITDLHSGRAIFDGDVEIPRQVAERMVYDIISDMFDGVNKESTKRDRKRAIRDNVRGFYDVIEEVLDKSVTVGLQEHEWFNMIVDYRNEAEDDDTMFVSEDETVLAVGRVAGNNHDVILQRLGEGEEYTIPKYTYGAAIGYSIERYLCGQDDITKLVDAITAAFTLKIQGLIYDEIQHVGDKLPVKEGFVGTGTLTAETKAEFDDILENVSAANNNAELLIFGTKKGLKALDGLAKIDWLDDATKKEHAQLGRLGSYEGTTLMEIGQRFADKTLTTKVFDDNMLFIIPVTAEKFVKMVDCGEVEINEVDSKGEKNGRQDDLGKYEVTREFGVASQVCHQLGVWTIKK